MAFKNASYPALKKKFNDPLMQKDAYRNSRQKTNTFKRKKNLALLKSTTFAIISFMALFAKRLFNMLKKILKL